MHSSWKRFWLELYTSKSWSYGQAPGRYLGVIITFDFCWVVATGIKIFKKNEDWDAKFMTPLIYFNLIVILGFALLTIYSIFKEKRGRQFLDLLTKSFKGRT